MHAAERERLILAALEPSGFVTYRDLEAALDASPATIRRDLSRLEAQGRLLRVHGGAKLTEDSDPAAQVHLLANGWIQPEESVVLFNTGSGLKYAHLWK